MAFIRALIAIAVVGGIALLALLAVDQFGGDGNTPTVSAAPAAPVDDTAVVTPAVPDGAGDAVVDYVHDGDTLFLTDGRKVRLLGIDTPEIGENLECLGDEATAALRAKLPEGAHVRTVADVQPLDQYGRTLLFLFTDDGRLVNLDLISEGYAEAVVLEPNVLWAAEVEAAEDAAQAAALGIWGSC